MKKTTSFAKIMQFSLVLVIPCSPLYTKNPENIRAQCFVEHPRYWKRFLTLKPLLARHGLDFVDHDADVILCNRVNPEILKLNLPIIILERKASSFLWGSTRKALKLPQVKAVFKNRILKDKSLYNKPVLNDSLHLKIINDYVIFST